MIPDEETLGASNPASVERSRKRPALSGTLLPALLVLTLLPACNAPPERKGEISAWEWQREQERWQGASQAIEHRDPVSAAVGVLFGYLVGTAFEEGGDDDETEE